jgi:hypothetical protein
MTGLRAVTKEGAERVVADVALAAFAAGFRGALLRPGAPGYDDARRVWNGMIDRRPALIARCAGPADVVCAVNFARDQDLLVSVKGGGHNITGNAVCEGGVMIDPSPMKGIRVDLARRTARAEAGLTWGEYNRETQAVLPQQHDDAVRRRQEDVRGDRQGDGVSTASIAVDAAIPVHSGGRRASRPINAKWRAVVPETEARAALKARTVDARAIPRDPPLSIIGRNS